MRGSTLQDIYTATYNLLGSITDVLTPLSPKRFIVPTGNVVAFLKEPSSFVIGDTTGRGG